MNSNELKFFSGVEHRFSDASQLPVWYLIKCLYVKLRRKTWGRLLDRNARLAWTVTAVSDAHGPADNVRNYLERRTIRKVLKSILTAGKVSAACEVGCGYGRMIMVLSEFANQVVGFEREPELVRMGRELQPDVNFVQCDDLRRIPEKAGNVFDIAMTCTVLQHLTDEMCAQVLAGIKKIVPSGYVLLIEKTETELVTVNITDGDSFISRARSVMDYESMMKPYVLMKQCERVLEPIYRNKRPGVCMLFASPDRSKNSGMQ
jgi:SAM-dependent methyltransferase